MGSIYDLGLKGWYFPVVLIIYNKTGILFLFSYPFVSFISRVEFGYFSAPKIQGSYNRYQCSSTFPHEHSFYDDEIEESMIVQRSIRGSG